jgi:hypothetical protein
MVPERPSASAGPADATWAIPDREICLGNRYGLSASEGIVVKGVILSNMDASIPMSTT